MRQSNGQPGRIKQIEDDVENLVGWRHKLKGIIAAVGAIGSFIGSAGLWVLKHFHLIKPF